MSEYRIYTLMDLQTEVETLVFDNATYSTIWGQDILIGTQMTGTIFFNFGDSSSDRLHLEWEFPPLTIAGKRLKGSGVRSKRTAATPSINHSHSFTEGDA